MKWCLVAAGLKDLTRPAEKLSVSQNVGACAFRLCGDSSASNEAIFVALAATGLIWVRYSFVITPVNYSLAAVRHYIHTYILAPYPYSLTLTALR